MHKVQSLFLYMLTISIALVAPKFRLGSWGLYDLCAVALWLSILAWPKPLRRLSSLSLSLRLFLLIIAIVFFGGVATLYSMNHYGIVVQPDFSYLLRFVLGLLIYLGVWLLVTDRPYRLSVITWLLASTAVYQTFLAIFNIGSHLRFLGTFTDPNYYAAYQSSIFVVLLALASEPNSSKRSIVSRIPLFIICFGIGLSVLLSFSRGGLLSFTLGSAFVIVVRLFHEKRRMVFPVFLVIVGAFLVLHIVQSTPSFARWSSRMTIDEIIAGGGAGRLTTWKQAVTAIIENPIGYGWGSEHLIIGRTGHNLFVESGIQFGLLGLILVVVFWIITGLDATRLFRRKPSTLELGFVAASIIMLISSLTVSSLLSRSFWFVLALGGATSNLIRDQYKKDYKVCES